MSVPLSPPRAAIAAERRESSIDDIRERTGLDEAMIAGVVHAFYGRVRADLLLGPIFASRIADWTPHLRRMTAFWCSVALMSGQYHGSPVEKHMRLPVDAAHFDRWLALFEATARNLCEPAAADHLVERARRIASSLELAAARERGLLLAPGERLPAGAGGACGTGRDVLS